MERGMTTQIKGDATSTFGSDIDVTGNVKTDNHAFSVIKTSDQAISQNTWTKVTFDTEDYDYESNFDLSNDKFIVPVTGLYQINASVRINGAVNVYLQLYKDGVGFGYFIQSNLGPVSSVTSQSLMLSHLIYLNADDEITFNAFAGGTSNTVTQGITKFNGYLARAV